MIHISSGDFSKYVTLDRKKVSVDDLHGFLSKIGISRERRKTIFKNHFIHQRGGKHREDYVGSLQVVSNQDKTISVEIFTTKETFILAIHLKREEDHSIVGEVLANIFD